MAVEYIGEEHQWMNVVKVRAGENKYEYYYGDFPITDAGEEDVYKRQGPSGITVNCVAPGVIDTDMMAAFTAEDKAALAEETLSLIHI